MFVLLCLALNPNTFCLTLTFLAGILMTVNALDDIPFVAVFHTKRVYAVFFPKIVWLTFCLSCKVHGNMISPSEATFSGDIIQSQPGFFVIMAVLQKHIFFIVVNINKDLVCLTASCGLVCAGFTNHRSQTSANRLLYNKKNSVMTK